MRDPTIPLLATAAWEPDMISEDITTGGQSAHSEMRLKNAQGPWYACRYAMGCLLQDGIA